MPCKPSLFSGRGEREKPGNILISLEPSFEETVASREQIIKKFFGNYFILWVHFFRKLKRDLLNSPSPISCSKTRWSTWSILPFNLKSIWNRWMPLTFHLNPFLLHFLLASCKPSKTSRRQQKILQAWRHIANRMYQAWGVRQDFGLHLWCNTSIWRRLHTHPSQKPTYFAAIGKALGL